MASAESFENVSVPPHQSTALSEEPTQSAVTPEKSLSFSKGTLSIAVDVSGSTTGRVLSEEEYVVGLVSEALENAAKARARILPWNNVALLIIKLDVAHHLYSGGGTRPSSLLDRGQPYESLQKCSLWILMTDGHIDGQEVRRFAMGIREARLHGTPCIIIVFGANPARPIECSISVGISVFGVTPDCFFLFHDVGKRQAYILQCKGCFKALLPADQDEILLDSKTSWKELPQLSYQRLFEIEVPLRARPAMNEMVLSDGSRINMQDLYHNRLDANQSAENLSNDDSLKSLLVTSATRGHSSETQDWISKQTYEMPDFLRMERPDIDGTAFSLVKRLIDLYQERGSNTPEQKELQARLRRAHELNWKTFVATVEYYQTRAKQRSLTQMSASTMLKAFEEDSFTSLESIGLVAPTRVRQSLVNSAPGFAIEGATQASSNSEAPPTMEAPTEVATSDLLYTPGYYHGLSRSRTGRCSLYGTDAAYSALLLKSPLAGDSRSMFLPQPERRDKVNYPMAVDYNPEVSIVSTFVCCDPCSVFAVRHGISPKGETLTASVALLNWFENASNRDKLLRTIDKAILQGFDWTQLPFVFLSILLDALDNSQRVSFPEKDVTKFALRPACRYISNSVKIPCFVHGEWLDIPITSVVKVGIQEQMQPEWFLLRHPVKSFVILVRAAFNSDALETDEESLCIAAIFQRLCFKIVDKYVSLQMKTGTQAALHSWQSIMEIPPYTSFAVPVDSLGFSHLLGSEALDAFRSIEELFESIETRCEHTIYLLLRQLGSFDPFEHGYSDAMKVFDDLKGMEGLSKLFSAPWDVSERDAREYVIRPPFGVVPIGKGR